METNAFSQIKFWAEEDRPREKLMLKGKTNLSDSELMAILIGSGTKQVSAVELSRQILHSVENDLSRLSKLTLHDLTKFNGIGEAKAINIISALELGKRNKEFLPSKRQKFVCSVDIFRFVEQHLNDLPHEEFWILLLDRKNCFIKMERISAGGISGTVVDSRILFKHAIESLASGVVLLHNHPSGDPKPSHLDILLTKKLAEAGKTLDVNVLDHIIVGAKQYFSFLDSGMM